MTHRTITKVDSVATSNMNHLNLHASIQGPKYTSVSLELHKPSIKVTKLLFQVTKAIIKKDQDCRGIAVTVSI